MISNFLHITKRVTCGRSFLRSFWAFRCHLHLFLSAPVKSSSARLLDDPDPAFGTCMTSSLALVTILVVIYAPDLPGH